MGATISMVMSVVSVVWPVAQPYVMAGLRHGLTLASGYLAAKGVPGLDDPTISNLAAVATGAAGVGWSWIEKAKR